MDLDGDVTAPKGRGIFEVLLGIVRLISSIAVRLACRHNWVQLIAFIQFTCCF